MPFVLVEVDNDGFQVLDPNGNAIGSVIDGATYRLLTETTFKSGEDVATQTTLAAILAQLDVDLSTRASESTLSSQLDITVSALRDAILGTGNKTLTDLETTLDAIKDTDGVKKITDQLPAGTNLLGKVDARLQDGSANLITSEVQGANRRLHVNAQLAAGTSILGSVKITDGSETAEVTADGRLRVDPSSIATGQGILNQHLLNASSDEMAIDGGAGTVFSWTPGSVHDVEGISLAVIVEDATIQFGDHWGGIDDLPNGLLIEARADDTDYTIANLQRTRELFQLTAPGGFDVYAATPDCCRGEILISGLIFRKSSSDYIRVTVRDDLTGLVHQSVLFKGKEID